MAMFACGLIVPLRVLLLALLALVWGAGGCGLAAEGPVVVLGAPDSPRLREVVAGLREGLAPRPLEVVTLPEFEANPAEVLSQIRGRRPPLLVVLGSPALSLVAPAEKRLPVVFAMVANPYVTGAADFPQHPEIHQKNITGIASPPPLTQALEQGARLLGPKTWGLLYDPREGQAVELARRFLAEAPKYGLTAITETSAEASTDPAGLHRLVARGARVLYLPPGAGAARYAPLLLAWGRERRVMVVSGHPEIDSPGAVLRVVLDYQALGKEAADLARRVLAGEKPEHIPIGEKVPLRLTVDEALLRHFSGYPGTPRTD